MDESMDRWMDRRIDGGSWMIEGYTYVYVDVGGRSERATDFFFALSTCGRRATASTVFKELPGMPVARQLLGLCSLPAGCRLLIVVDADRHAACSWYRSVVSGSGQLYLVRQ